MALDSSTSCVVRKDATTDCCAGGIARLKFDFVAILNVYKNRRRTFMVVYVEYPYSRDSVTRVEAAAGNLRVAVWVV